LLARLNELTSLWRRYLRPQWLRTVVLALVFFTGIALQLVSPQVLRLFIDNLQSSSSATLARIALLFLSVVLVERGVAIATTYFSQSVAWRAMNGVRRDLASHVLRLDMSFHHAHTPGELLERVHGDVDRLANLFSEFLLQIVGGLILAAGVLLLLAEEDWRLATLLALFVATYVLVHARGQALAGPLWAKERQISAELSGFVEERIAGARDIHTSGAASYTIHRFFALLRRRTWQALRADIMTDVGWTISKIFYDLGTVAGMALAAYLFYQGTISLGVVYLTIHYFGLLNEPLNRIGGQIEDLQQALVAIRRVRELLSTPSQLVAGQRRGLAQARGMPVHFQKVDFAYSPATPVLQGVSFALAPGQALGLLGRTGSGKSTIARLLFRLYDATAGTIEVAGEEIRAWDLAELRRNVGLVTQEVQLFPASLRDNLTLFDDTVSDAAIWQGLDELGLTQWVSQLPDGLDTRLATAGNGLSAGEAQLLALARLWLKDPPLIILDEASSRLDPATERLLEQALDRLLTGRTAIIIAHRLRTVRRADQILVLERGSVKEYGPAEQLAADPNSIYAGLLRMAANGVDPLLTSDPILDGADGSTDQPVDPAQFLVHPEAVPLFAQLVNQTATHPATEEVRG
jgi:ABC-type multidrug transport system fused ATPase/permease subunit